MAVVINNDGLLFEDGSGNPGAPFMDRARLFQEQLQAYEESAEYAPTTAALNGKFSVSIFKSLIASPLRTWVNTYEMVAAPGTLISAVVPLATALVKYERAFHLDAVYFDHYNISTWSPDSKPYDPTTFVGFVIGTNGQRVLGNGQIEPLKVVVKAKRAVVSGRNGRMFYRGSAVEGDIQSNAGEPVGDSGGTFGTLVTAYAGAATELFPFLGSGSSLVKLALIGKTGLARTLTELKLTGFTVVSNNHRYFDRA